MIQWDDERHKQADRSDSEFDLFMNAFEGVYKNQQSMMAQIEQFMSRNDPNYIAELVSKATQDFQQDLQSIKQQLQNTETNLSNQSAVEVRKIMAEIDDLNAAIATLQTTANTVSGQVQAELNNLQNLVNTQAPAPSLLASIQTLQTLTAQFASVGTETPTNAPAPATTTTTP